ncbi:MAG: hypothetical protein HWE10_10990 [Gammaproteobacteria bacterium]|nr:hypothetical protein [Gammaproteobacteria bacterium]
MKTLIQSLLLIVVALISTDSLAHKMKAAFSIILFNERTNNLEAVHRFYLHDAEEAVWEMFDSNADIIGSEETQQKFADYVIKNFELKDQAGNPISLDTVGYQNDGGYFWVYQETPQPKGLTKLHIKQQALQDIWSQQFNVVNVEGLDKVYSLNFTSRDEWQSITLPEDRH